MILFYLLPAVILQSDVPALTYAHPYETLAMCEAAIVSVTADLERETAMPSPDNAGAYSLKCVAMDVGEVKHPQPDFVPPTVWPAPKRDL